MKSIKDTKGIDAYKDSLLNSKMDYMITSDQYKRDLNKKSKRTEKRPHKDRS